MERNLKVITHKETQQHE